MMIVRRGSYEMKAVGDINGHLMMLEEAGPNQFIVHTDDQTVEYVTVELDRESMKEWIGILQKALADTEGEL